MDVSGIRIIVEITENGSVFTIRIEEIDNFQAENSGAGILSVIYSKNNSRNLQVIIGTKKFSLENRSREDLDWLHGNFDNTQAYEL